MFSQATCPERSRMKGCGYRFSFRIPQSEIRNLMRAVYFLASGAAGLAARRTLSSRFRTIRS